MPSEYYLELSEAGVAPAESPYDKGITLKDGKTEPFLVKRGWSGVMGHYWEQWSIRKDGREVLYSHPPQQVSVRGFQSVTRYVDRVETPIEIPPGEYNLVFIVEGYFMGSAEIQIKEPPADTPEAKAS